MKAERNSPVEVVRLFNDCISRRDAEGLSELLTEDHVFIGSAGHAVSGKNACVDAWRGFFDAFPDYYNVIERMETKHNLVAVAGHSVCSDIRLHGPALWKAIVVDDRLAEWHVFDDTEENRRRLALES
ncbi:nuclear transport factor 2 family protein [Loktanella sp. IMCC34160]|uniref:nuclear transport factor 2 family protein n=1 Tax=Loktanella sp. IMCC34160 TaxID=2510646 RepID=UPI00101D8EA9|nr:nuclear transport factor 2 family protein [Loktanella sp. IMCC34160]RYG90000.1 nuclear transport factor 2 family protein [Loktanella sp. IMCC34160]